MSAQTRLRLLVLGSVGALLVVVLLAIILGRAPVRPPLPNPNGYDDFLKAGAAVSGSVSDFPTLDHDSLRDLVATNAEALRLLRLGLTRQCSVPAEVAMTNTAAMLNELSDMKRLVQLLAAQGRLREMDNQPAEAARSYLDAIRFGNEISRGGFLINRLVGIACEAIGRSPLAKLVPSLKPEAARPIIADLEKIEQTHVTWDEALRNENRFLRHQLRANPNPVIWVTSLWQLRPAMRRAAEKHNRILAYERLLAAELALRCYQSEKARPPARLAELVPNYLSQVPLDPFTGQPLVYRPQGTNWLLYSIGPDGVDDVGKSVARGSLSNGDLLFDSP
jgi:hypothetical protein